MSVTIDDLVARIKGHRCYNHPIFHDWAEVEPAPEAVGALFHQIQKFCASTRPGWNFPQALDELGLKKQSQLLAEIVESESDHGPQLATMAGFIVNRTARQAVCAGTWNDSATTGERMAAYLVGRMKITDVTRYERYKECTPSIIASYGGRFLARGGRRLILEGPEDDRRIVLVEFASMKDAEAFYNSPAYRAARDVREGAAREIELVVVEGFE